MSNGMGCDHCGRSWRRCRCGLGDVPTAEPLVFPIKRVEQEFGMPPQMVFFVEGKRQSVPCLVPCQAGQLLMIVTPSCGNGD